MTIEPLAGPLTGTVLAVRIVPSGSKSPAFVRSPIAELSSLITWNSLSRTGAQLMRVIVTSSKASGHGELLIVHLKVTGPPTSPRIGVLGEFGLSIVAVPLTTVQVPIPMAAVFPAITAVSWQAMVWSVPAFAVVGFSLKRMFTSSNVVAQGGVATVHRKVYVVPAMPLKTEVGLAGVTMVPPTPAMIVQFPVPEPGALPARLRLVRPQVLGPI